MRELLLALLALLCAQTSGFSGFAIVEFRTPMIDERGFENAVSPTIITRNLRVDTLGGTFPSKALLMELNCPQYNKELNCRGDLLRTEITEFNICYKVSGKLGVSHSYMLDYHDDYKASYYHYNNADCNPSGGGRIKLQNMFSGSCNVDITEYAGEVQNQPYSWLWADTKQSLAQGVAGPVRALYKGSTWCSGKPVYVMYPPSSGVCTVNITDTIGGAMGEDSNYIPANPRPLGQRAYFTTKCAVDGVSFFIQNYREQIKDLGMWRLRDSVQTEEEITDFRAVQYGHTQRCLFLNETDTVNYPKETVTPTCVTDGYDSWRANNVGCRRL